MSGGGSRLEAGALPQATQARSKPWRGLAPLGLGLHLNAAASPPPSPSCKRLWNTAPPLAHDNDGSDSDESPSVWEGEVVRREGRRNFFDTLVKRDRSGAEKYNCGDDVMVLASKNNLPYVARIEALIEDEGSCDEGGQGKQALLKWYYRSSDCCKEKHKTTSRKELFASDFTDMNSVESIMKPCWILTHRMFLEYGSDAYDDVYFCREHYCPIARRFDPFDAQMSQRDFSAAIQDLERRKAAAYLQPNVGSEYQCVVPEAPLRCTSPVRDRDDELVFSPAHLATAGSDQVSSFLARWEGVVPGRSKGLSHEMALTVLHQCMGDLSLADSKLKAMHTSTSQAASQPLRKSGGSGSRARHAAGAAGLEVGSGRPPRASSGLADLARVAASSELAHEEARQLKGAGEQAGDGQELTATRRPQQYGGRVGRGGDGQARTEMESEESSSGSAVLDSAQACRGTEADEDDSEMVMDVVMDVVPSDKDARMQAAPDLSSRGGGSRQVRAEAPRRSRGRRASPLVSCSPVVCSRSPPRAGAQQHEDVSSKPPAHKAASTPSSAARQRSPMGAFTVSSRKARTRNSAAVALAIADQTVTGRMDSEQVAQGLERPGKQKRSSKSGRSESEACKKVKVARKSEGVPAVKGASTSREANGSKCKIPDAVTRWASRRGSGSESGELSGEVSGEVSAQASPKPTGRGRSKAWQSSSEAEAEASSDRGRSMTPPSERGSMTPPVTRNVARASTTPPPGTRGSSKGAPDVAEFSPSLRQRSVPIDRFKPGKGGTISIKSTPPRVPAKVLEQRTYLESAGWRGRTYKVGDFVRLASPKTKDKDYIAVIVGIWQGAKEVMIKCRWFYSLDDVPLEHRSGVVIEPKEVLASSHCDLNSISSIEGPCKVMHVSDYVARAKASQGDRNTLFFRRLYDSAAGQCHEISRDWHTQDLLARVERYRLTSKKEPAR